MVKRIETTTTAGRNRGMHDTRQYKKACAMLDNHTFTNAQLWHMVVTNKDDKDEKDRFREDRYAHEQALQQVADKLRDSGMEVEYKAAYELCPTKGFHRHVFFLIEAKDHKPAGILRYRPNGWLVETMARYGFGFYLAPPKNAIHRTRKGRQKKYAYVPKTPGAMLDDCKDWIGYPFKNRTKDGVAAPIYSSSRKKAKKVAPAAPAVQEAPVQQAAPVAQAKRAPAPAPAPQADPVQPTTTNEGDSTVTPAEFEYVGKVYAQLVAQGMDLNQIQSAVAKQGIRRRTQYQTIFELEDVFGHAGYAATHGAPAVISVAEFDAAIDRGTDRASRADRETIR
jgi:hypothetical protein